MTDRLDFCYNSHVMKALVKVALVLTFSGPGLWGQDSSLESAFEGDAVKRARLADLQGTEKPPPLIVDSWVNSEAMSLADLKGKIVVLDFWATWCGPCLRAVPHTNQLAEKYKDQVVFIGVCSTRGAEKMAETIAKSDIKYPVCKDVDNKTKNAYEVNGFPDYYIIDQNGKLVVADCQNAKVEEVIETLLKGDS
ncbi:MAG: redoxin domain-containing protein [Verrucomicrobiales bacterium]|nr:redoxin domain-containing protein [Verrucomicrobiales bacterium]